MSDRGIAKYPRLTWNLLNRGDDLCLEPPRFSLHPRPPDYCLHLLHPYIEGRHRGTHRHKA
jgi:hypothetical protein